MILVTGGAGFIGSVLVRALNEMGRKDIVIVDRLRDGDKWENLKKADFLEYLLVEDFISESVQDLFAKLDFVFHMGACSSTTERDVDYLMDNNVQFSKIIFSLCAEFDVPLVYASSAATYGDGELGYDDDHSKGQALMPLNPYGFSKQIFDKWVLQQKKTPPHWYGVKFFNVFGPNEYHKEEMRSLVHKAHGQIQETGKVKLFKSHRDDFEDGKQLRDFIYVKDCVNAMLAMMQEGNASKSGIYNLGTGKARSFLDLVSATFKAMGKEPNIEFIDMPMSIRNQYQYYTQAEMNKFRSAFPQVEFHELEDAVADYVSQYLEKDDPHY